jgi:hypothetical protein
MKNAKELDSLLTKIYDVRLLNDFPNLYHLPLQANLPNKRANK